MKEFLRFISKNKLCLFVEVLGISLAFAFTIPCRATDRLGAKQHEVDNGKTKAGRGDVILCQVQQGNTSSATQLLTYETDYIIVSRISFNTYNESAAG